MEGTAAVDQDGAPVRRDGAAGVIDQDCDLQRAAIGRLEHTRVGNAAGTVQEKRPRRHVRVDDPRDAIHHRQTAVSDDSISLNLVVEVRERETTAVLLHVHMAVRIAAVERYGASALERHVAGDVEVGVAAAARVELHVALVGERPKERGGGAEGTGVGARTRKGDHVEHSRDAGLQRPSSRGGQGPSCDGRTHVHRAAARRDASARIGDIGGDLQDAPAGGLEQAGVRESAAAVKDERLPRSVGVYRATRRIGEAQAPVADDPISLDLVVDVREREAAPILLHVYVPVRVAAVERDGAPAHQGHVGVDVKVGVAAAARVELDAALVGDGAEERGRAPEGAGVGARSRDSHGVEHGGAIRLQYPGSRRRQHPAGDRCAHVHGSVAGRDCPPRVGDVRRELQDASARGLQEAGVGNAARAVQEQRLA